jgi:hypothetical protein
MAVQVLDGSCVWTKRVTNRCSVVGTAGSEPDVGRGPTHVKDAVTMWAKNRAWRFGIPIFPC